MRSLEPHADTPVRPRPVSRGGAVAGLAVLFGLVCLCPACAFSYRIKVDPGDSVLTVNGKPVEAGRTYEAEGEAIEVSARREGHEDFSRTYTLSGGPAADEIDVRLAKKKYRVEVRLAEGRAAVRIDGAAVSLPFRGELPYGEHRLELNGSGGAGQTTSIDVRRNETFVFRPQTEALPVRPIGVYACGRQPKQVIFSPDNKYLYLCLLDGEGFQVFDVEKREMRATVKVGPKARLKGFPEGLFIESERTFLISQMTTNSIFEYAYGADGTAEYRRMFPTLGAWPKFMAYAPSLDLLAVSNWVTSDVALIEYRTGRAVHKLRGLDTPRGLSFSPDGKSLYIASYDGGCLYKYDTASWRETGRFYRKRGAMRHIALDPARRLLFVDDMANFIVFELDMDSLKLLHSYQTSHHPNTIGLTPDGRWLFVSCRGPNNPKDYTLRSPENGVVMLFDTVGKTLVSAIRGGNQPTGLAVSPDGRLLAFSNFLDANFELYDITALAQEVRP